jgi:spermidine synthase
MATVELASVRNPSKTSANLSLFYLLFFLSGFPALLYQIVWQRALFTLYGVNIESVTMIVTVFMLGLGLGSLAGGRLSSHPKINPLLSFGLIESSIGLFGIFSLSIFHRVGELTAGGSAIATGAIAFGLLLIPTFLMGSTLPLLTEHAVRSTGNVGESVGLLYSVNTFGSGVACFAAAYFLMRILGESGTVTVAFIFNLTVGATAVLLGSRKNEHIRQTATGQAAHPRLIPAPAGILLAGLVGFVALGYEIIWYRLYSFTSEGTAKCFAELLGFYLIGIGYGSLSVRDICRKPQMNSGILLWKTSQIVLLGTIISFLLGPLLARFVVHFPYEPTYALVFLAASLLGAAFPLIAHLTIRAGDDTGKNVSYLYLSNVIGSTLGSFLIGFVILDHVSTQITSTVLLCVGFAIYLVLFHLSRIKGKVAALAMASAAFLALMLFSRPLYSGIYERLLLKSHYSQGTKFASLVENRSGVIAVSTNGIVFGGGAYDGRFSTDLVNDSNGIFRAFAVSGMKAYPTSVLIIGLSSGSWAQVVANDPTVKDITIVEINPGYEPLIRNRKEVQSLLLNPKVRIITDDGRRWLVSHRDRKFDFILMNTTYHYRANTSNLLSREFLLLMRRHLNQGGIAFYNTTWSLEALATGIEVFPYALRITNFLAVSDSPFTLDKARWREALTNYSIDGKPVFDTSNPGDRKRLEEVLHAADLSDDSGNSESRESLMKRLTNVQIVTDDNMKTEWR